MRNPPFISVVLGTYNRLEFLKLTIQSIRQELAGFRHEILVVDGGSTDGTGKWLIQQKDIITIVQHNRGEWMGNPIERKSWGYFMNLAFKSAQGKFVCMVSDDCLIIPGAIRNGYALFEERLSNGENIGAMAFYWRNWPEQKTYRVGQVVGGRIFVNHGIYLNEALSKVGYIDEENYQFYHADSDLCLKLWKDGYLCIDAPQSFIEHYSHANMKVRKTNSDLQKEDERFFLSRWDGLFKGLDINTCGSWIEKEYSDPAETYRYFLKIHKRDLATKRAFRYFSKWKAPFRWLMQLIRN